MKKLISLLGSTGSIGTQTLEVVRNNPELEITALAANKNIALLEAQIREFLPIMVVVWEENLADELEKRLKKNPVFLMPEIQFGMEGLKAAATHPETNMVVNALVGNIGMLPTLAAVESGKDVALANKETLVTAGKLVMKRAKEKGVCILPVDSEHSAIFQCLQGNEKNPVRSVLLTASGGPFLNRDINTFGQITVNEALKHPNWTMGRKITIDSATMMNKGLEVIEARWLFDIPPEQIQVVIHPQSIIHSMVEYADGAVMAQLGAPDMKLPIQYALTYPYRKECPGGKLDFRNIKTFTFENPDFDRFPCLKLAFEALSMGGDMPAVLNGANEVCVQLFLEGKIRFMDIPRLINEAMEAYTVKQDYTVQDIVLADQWAREYIFNR